MLENNYCVYKHTSPSNKVYIGITSQKPEKRWKNGYGYSRNTYFSRAIQKYGWDNFTHEILFTGLTKEEAEKKEIELIAFYKSTNKDFGYNIDNGGNTIGKHSDETKNKISNALRGHHHSDESKRKMSSSLKGRTVWNKGKKCEPLSDETRQKLSNALSGEKNPFYGKHHTEESRRKMSEAAKNMSDETKRKMSEARKGKHHTEESRKKMCKAQKGENNGFYGKHHSENSKEKNRQAHLGQKHTAKRADAYKEYKANGGLLKWNEFQKEYNNLIAITN